MANNFGFTTTPRLARSEGVNGLRAKIGSTVSGNLISNEYVNLQNMINSGFMLLNVGSASYDSTATVSCSLTSASIVQFTIALTA